MIRIDKYGIEAYERGYQVGKIATTTIKKTNETREYLAHPAFLDSIPKCLKKIRFWMHLEAIEQYDGELNGAIKALETADVRFDALVDGLERR
jgi:hypothetical protein